MADRIENRLTLLGLSSDGSELQKAMQHRVKRSYGRPVHTQVFADPITTKEATTPTSNPPSLPITHEKRLQSLFPSEAQASLVDESEKASSPSSSSGATSSTSALSTSVLDTPCQPPPSIVMTSAATPPQGRSDRPFVGMPAPINETFCALLAISKLPYKFILDKDIGQRISVEFFAEGKFFRRGWTIYYIYPTANSSQPLLLLPQSEVHAFIQAINGAFPKAGLSLTRLNGRFPGLTIQFRSNHSQLRPRFLGVVHTQEQYQSLQNNIPGSQFKVPRLLVEPELDEDHPEIKRYDLQLFQALDLGGNKKKGSSKKATPQAREEHQTSMQLDFKANLEMVERFLGLRASKPKRPSAASGLESNSKGKSWEEERADMATMAGLKAPPAPIDPNKPPECAFHSNVIFVCVDVEAYEKDSSKITEIGISTLDTKNLEGVAPGEAGSHWRSKVHARHFRIQEHSHLRNGTFVHDNAANFKFGASEFIPLGEAPKTVAACFRGYGSTEVVDQAEKRTIVLVGHDVAADVRFLLRMGYDVSNLSTLHPSNPVIDTQKLFRAYQKIKKPSLATAGQQPVSLAVVMEELDIAPFGLHNAGNDAAYTMQVMIGMAVESAQLRKNVAVADEDWNGDMNAFKKPAKAEDDGSAYQKLDEADW